MRGEGKNRREAPSAASLQPLKKCLNFWYYVTFLSNLNKQYIVQLCEEVQFSNDTIMATNGVAEIYQASSKLAKYPFEPYWPQEKLKICITGAGGFIAR